MHDHDRASAHWFEPAPAAAVTPGKRTLTQAIQRMQRDAPAAPPTPPAPPVAAAMLAAPAADPFWFCAGDGIEAAAARGVDTPASPLPHADRIAASFGRHAIDGITAHTGDGAAAAARDMGAHAFATGNHVVLGDTSLHTVAHEAAHVMQQRAGVHARTGDDDHGDPWERHADDVAAAVVRGESAEALLDELAPPGARDLAPAPAPAVGPVQRMKFDDHGNEKWFGGTHDTEDGANFAHWIGQLRAHGDVATLTAIRDALHRDVFTLSRNEAVAKSMVQRELDALSEQAHPAPAPGGGAQGQVGNLPRDRWWKMFIEGDKHNPLHSDYRNAMRFDGDQSPGYYAAMMRAFDRHVANTDGHQLNFDDYNAMHVDCTRDILRSTRGGGFESVPHKLSAQNITFPMTQGEYPNPRALRELEQEHVLGMQPDLQQIWGPGFGGQSGAVRNQVNTALDGIGDLHEMGVPFDTAGRRPQVLLGLGSIYQHQGPANTYSSMLHPTHVMSTDQMQMNIHTNRDEGQARGEVNALFTTYYQHIQNINANGALAAPRRRHKKLKAIARLVRALHVGHYFHDANGRLNTMLLLDRLLVDAGFAPVIMQRTDIFGGAYTANELVAAIEVGLQAFQHEVTNAHPVPVVPLILGGGDDDSDSSEGASDSL